MAEKTGCEVDGLHSGLIVDDRPRDVIAAELDRLQRERLLALDTPPTDIGERGGVGGRARAGGP